MEGKLVLVRSVVLRAVEVILVAVKVSVVLLNVNVGSDPNKPESLN